MVWDPEGVLGSIRSRPLFLYRTKLHSGGRVVKSWPARAKAAREEGSVPGSGRSPGGGNGNLLQYSCLEKSVDRSLASNSPWVTKSQTRLSHWANWGKEKMVPWWKWWSPDGRVWMMLTPSLPAFLLIQWGTGVKLAKSDFCHPFWVPWPQAGWRGQLTFSQPERDLCQSLETKFSVCAQSDFPENCRVWAP